MMMAVENQAVSLPLLTAVLPLPLAQEAYPWAT